MNDFATLGHIPDSSQGGRYNLNHGQRGVPPVGTVCVFTDTRDGKTKAALIIAPALQSETAGVQVQAIVWNYNGQQENMRLPFSREPRPGFLSPGPDRSPGQ
jgi:hypothetical protein